MCSTRTLAIWIACDFFDHRLNMHLHRALHRVVITNRPKVVNHKTFWDFSKPNLRMVKPVAHVWPMMCKLGRYEVKIKPDWARCVRSFFSVCVSASISPSSLERFGGQMQGALIMDDFSFCNVYLIFSFLSLFWTWPPKVLVLSWIRSWLDNIMVSVCVV